MTNFSLNASQIGSLCVRTISALCCVFFLHTSLIAQPDDRCSDVLRNGTFQNAKYRENNFFQQIIWSRFLSSSYEESKTNRDLGFGIPIGEIVMGGNYDEAQFNQKKQDVQREMSNTLTSYSEIDAALTSGDRVIVENWTQCMNQRGGKLLLRFEAVTATELFARLEWRPGIAGTETGVAKTKLTQSVTIPSGIKVISGEKCFKKGASIGPAGCEATLQTESATTVVTLSVNAKHGSTRASAAPRIKMEREVRPFQFQKEHKLEATAFRSERRPGIAITLTPTEVGEGWRFMPSTQKATLVIDRKGHWVHTCDSLTMSADLFNVAYSYRIFASGRNSPERNSDIACHIEPSIIVFRDRWVPIGVGNQRVVWHPPGPRN